MNRVLFITHNCDFASKFLVPQIDLYKDLGFTVYLASSLDLGFPPSEVDKFIEININQSPFKIKLNYKAFKQLKKIVFEENIDVINCHTPMGGVLGRLLKIPYPELEVIYTAHGFHFYKGSSFTSWLIYYPVEKILSIYTDKLITINEEDFNLIKNRRFKSKKIFLINGVGVETIQPKKSFVQKIVYDYNLINSFPVLICIGQLNKNKNHRLVIETMPKIIKTYPNSKLLIIGDGPLKGELQNLIENLELSKSVYLVGYSKLVIEFLSVSTILISASIREGLPKNVMEALNMNVPCLVSNCRGNRDLVVDKINGYIFKKNSTNSLFDGIDFIINNYEFLKKNTKMSIQSFLLESVINEYKNVFVEEV